MSLTEVCRRLEMGKGAGYRLLSGLEKRGYVEQDAASERYRLTLHATAFGLRYLSELRLTEVCQPVLDRLAASTGEMVRMCVANGPNLTWVAKSQGALTGLRYDPDMGQSVVLHATAVGRVWLATMDDEKAASIVRQRGFEVPARFCRRFITDEEGLLAELHATRDRGFGLAREEGEAGMAAIACAIFDAPGPNALSVGAVSVAGPIARLTESRVSEISASVREAAAELTGLWPIRRYIAGQRSQTPAAPSRVRAQGNPAAEGA